MLSIVYVWFFLLEVSVQIILAHSKQLSSNRIYVYSVYYLVMQSLKLCNLLLVLFVQVVSQELQAAQSENHVETANPEHEPGTNLHEQWSPRNVEFARGMMNHIIDTP